MTQSRNESHQECTEHVNYTAAHHSLIEWCLIITVASLGIIGLIQGIIESSVLFSAICGILLTGVSIILMRDRFHVLLEQYEFLVVWLVVLGIAGYGIYHVLIGVFFI
jgi:hypothetical protein